MPDILALQEVQDNDGNEVSDVVASDETLQTLIDQIEAIQPGAGYDFFVLDPVDDVEGGIGGGNIRVAFLFKPAKVHVDSATAERIQGPAFDRTYFSCAGATALNRFELRMTTVAIRR